MNTQPILSTTKVLAELRKADVKTGSRNDTWSGNYAYVTVQKYTTIHRIEVQVKGDRYGKSYNLFNDSSKRVNTQSEAILAVYRALKSRGLFVSIEAVNRHLISPWYNIVVFATQDQLDRFNATTNAATEEEVLNAAAERKNREKQYEITKLEEQRARIVAEYEAKLAELDSQINAKRAELA